MIIIEAQNIRQDGDIADYSVKVKVNLETIALLYVRGHDRRKGWPDLLRMIADAQEESDGREAGAQTSIKR